MVGLECCSLQCGPAAASIAAMPAILDRPDCDYCQYAGQQSQYAAACPAPPPATAPPPLTHSNTTGRPADQADTLSWHTSAVAIGGCGRPAVLTVEVSRVSRSVAAWHSLVLVSTQCDHRHTATPPHYHSAISPNATTPHHQTPQQHQTTQPHTATTPHRHTTKRQTTKRHTDNRHNTKSNTDKRHSATHSHPHTAKCHTANCHITECNTDMPHRQSPHY